MNTKRTNGQRSQISEKAHYKFYYKPVTSARADKEYILLDILYEKSHYGEHTAEIPIQSSFLLTEGEQTKVTVPVPEAILGDKLTAYALTPPEYPTDWIKKLNHQTAI
ncbi:MAG: hypothetical protein R2806_14660 [Saprospiraceae bacterium]